MQRVRRRSLWKIAVGAIALAIEVPVFIYLEDWELPTFLNRILMLIAALPVGIGFAGLLELISGRPFVELAKHWDSLKGWQRGIIGISAVIGAFSLLIAFAWFYLSTANR